MPLRAWLRPWSSRAYRHIPAGSPYGVLDLRFARRGGDHRWSAPGEPTLYLASDEAVVLGEFARHFREDRGTALAPGALEREMYSLVATLATILDLREPGIWAALALDNPPACFLDRALARATAQFLRLSTPVQGLLVPSVAFLDQLHRWVAVLFLEKLPHDASQFLREVRYEFRFRVEV